MNVLGLISGTSIDAIDAALVEIKRDEQCAATGRQSVPHAAMG